MPDSSDWPQEIRKPTVLANFRPSVAERAKVAPTWRAKRTGMSPAHLALVRQLSCTLGPERYRIECHHLKTGPARQTRGLGLKAVDRWVVPLFWLRHSDLERLGSRHEFSFFMDHRMNPYDLADALWLNTGDLEAMRDVLVAHKQDAIRQCNDARKSDAGLRR